MRDLVVAGGGPVGLAAAVMAAEAGLDVEVRERRPGVVDKACGEGLMPGAVTALRALGVPLDGRPIRGIRYVDDAHHADAPFGSGPGLGVRRTALHAALRERAAAAGVVPLARPVARVDQRADHVLVDGDPARYLLAADGLHSTVRRLVGLAEPVRGRRRYGQRRHALVEPWSDLVEVHWGRAAEAYVTPVAGNLVGVALLGTERRPFDEQLRDFPALAARVADRFAPGVRGAGPLRQRSRRRVAGRVLLAGDAAGYVDALTGEGIALGLAQARAAVDAVLADAPALYEAAWRRVTWRHELLTRLLLRATAVPAVRHRIVGAASALPPVFRAAVDQLARPA